jgi:DHA2 family multidrug resistance protein
MRKPNWSVFRDTDFLGVAGLILGLGGLTIVLEEGQRERWFESTMIRELSIVSLIGIAILVVGQFVARKPVIQLRILLQRSFAGVFIMSLMVGAALYGVLYIIPQFLSAVPGYDSEQSGLIAAISGVPTILMLAFFPLLARRIDLRAAIAFGLLLYGISCFMTADLTVDSAGPQFIASQILRGFAQFFSMLFLNQAATNSVARDYAEDASGLFNAARNLGGSFGLAAIATLQDRRQTLHVTRLSEAITANSLSGQAAVRAHGVAWLNNAIQAQATVMTYSDLYWVFGVALLLMIPLVLLLKPLPRDADRSIRA